MITCTWSTLTSFCAPSTPGCGLPWLSCESASSTLMPVRFKPFQRLGDLVDAEPRRLVPSLPVRGRIAGQAGKDAVFQIERHIALGGCRAPGQCERGGRGETKNRFQRAHVLPSPSRQNRAEHPSLAASMAIAGSSRLTASLEAHGTGIVSISRVLPTQHQGGGWWPSAPLRHRRRAVLDLAMRQHPILPDRNVGNEPCTRANLERRRRERRDGNFPMPFVAAGERRVRPGRAPKPARLRLPSGRPTARCPPRGARRAGRHAPSLLRSAASD